MIYARICLAGFYLSLGMAAYACTKQQTVTGVNTAVNVAVSACAVAPQLLPPNTPAGSVVALLCPLVDNSAQQVEVLVDNLVWNAMVKQYQSMHPGFVVRTANDADVNTYRASHP